MISRTRFLAVLATSGMLLSAAGCASKSTPATTPKAAPPAPPPQTLTMNVDVTPPKPPAPPPPPPAPQPAPTPPPKADPCAVLSDRLASLRVHFDYDRSTISQPAKAEVDAISAAIKSSGVAAGARFSIEGHCDAMGSESYNIALSERRAKAVLDRLVDLGAITAAQARPQPWGKQKPLDPGNTPEAYAKNRRVEVVVASCDSK